MTAPVSSTGYTPGSSPPRQETVTNQQVQLIQDPNLLDRTISGLVKELIEKPAELRSLLRIMPTGGILHAHTTGEIPVDDLLRYAIREGMYYDRVQKIFKRELEPADTSQTVLAADYLHREVEEAVSVRNDESISFQTKHEHFFKTFRTIESLTDHNMPLSEQLLPIIRNAMAMHISYLELMKEMKNSLPEGYKEQFCFIDGDFDHLRRSLQFLQPWLNDFVKDWKNRLEIVDQELREKLGWPTSIYDAESPVVLRFLGEVMRTTELYEIFADLCAAFFLSKECENKVVGIQLVGEENDFKARSQNRKILHMIQFLSQEYDQKNIALHAGELVTELSPDAQFNPIKDAVEIGGAKRIGHGVNIVSEQYHRETLQTMAGNEIAVEMSPTSNHVILGLPPADQPYAVYRRYRVPIVFATDDGQILRTNIQEEILKAVRAHRLNWGEIVSAIRNSLQYSFLQGEGIYRRRDHYTMLRKEFFGCEENDWQPKQSSAEILNNSEKARLQVRLEQDLYRFRRQISEEFSKGSEDSLNRIFA